MPTTPSIGKDVDELSRTTSRSIKWNHHSGNSEVSIQLNARKTLHSLGVGMSASSHQKTQMRIYIVALFRVASDWKSANVLQQWNIEIRIQSPSGILVSDEEAQTTVIFNNIDESHRENIE